MYSSRGATHFSIAVAAHLKLGASLMLWSVSLNICVSLLLLSVLFALSDLCYCHRLLYYIHVTIKREVFPYAATYFLIV